MSAKLPTCRKCCCCVPLRYGLLLWAYLKLLVSSLLFSAACIFFSQPKTPYESGADFVYALIAIIEEFVDVILILTFIVGCYKKNVNLIRNYYFYSLLMLALSTPMNLYHIFGKSYNRFKYEHEKYAFTMLGIDLFTFIVSIALQIYLVLLIRSEIIKLNKGLKFGLEKNSLEAECTLNVNTSNTEKDGYQEYNNEEMKTNV